MPKLFKHRLASGCAFAFPILSLVAPLRGDEPFDYFRNSWNVIGLKDYTDGTRVTPENELIVSDSERIRIRYGRGLTALSRQQTKTLQDGWLPIVLLSARDEDVRYDFTLWATPLPMVKDWQRAFDWPTEGENFLNWIRINVTNSGINTAEAKAQIEQYGTSSSVAKPLQSSSWLLAPGESAQAVVRVPFAPIDSPTDIEAEDAGLWLDRTVQFWRGLKDKAARVEVPCEKATKALLAAHMCQLIANDHGELRGGEGFYDEFYIRDGGYQIMELEEAGLLDAAEKAVGHYLLRQRPDGRFETQSGQFDANGQALWVLWQYYKITGDRPWLEKAYPQMRRAVDWLMTARREAPATSPYAGVLPAAIADGEYLWDGKHHIVGYDLWNLRGLLCTADAATALGRKDEAENLREEAADYRTAIDKAWKQTGLPHFPPSWEKAGTHWGNTETLWPTELFARDDPRVTALLKEVREHHGGGFIEGTIQWLGRPDAIHPYMSAYSTMASLVRGEHEQVVEDFYWYLLHSAATHAFPEGIYYKRRFAWSHTIPHVTGASNYALLLRHMVLHEKGDELHLLLAVPDWWLDQGREIQVERAPTHFGEMGFRIRGLAEGVQVEIQHPRRDPPKRIVLHLPESRPPIQLPDGVEVELRTDQARRWDFPTVVSLYSRTAPPLLMPPILGLVTFPLDRALPPEHCHLIDISAVSNTDPFTAPFGVANPGKFLFSGLPVGVQTIGGVPFRIIDPAKNSGSAFVVLHSPKAPKNREWPREIEIPVKEKGRRLFFLGNVDGWGPQDEGAGPSGAVAEYLIHYADGQEHTVPLIRGRTIEDWTTRQSDAPEVFRGLQGDPWHLNLLGVELRPVEVDRIVFRDLDTVSAPLLAGVTLEK